MFIDKNKIRVILIEKERESVCKEFDNGPNDFIKINYSFWRLFIDQWKVKITSPGTFLWSKKEKKKQRRERISLKNLEKV